MGNYKGFSQHLVNESCKMEIKTFFIDGISIILGHYLTTNTAYLWFVFQKINPRNFSDTTTLSFFPFDCLTIIIILAESISEIFKLTTSDKRNPAA